MIFVIVKLDLTITSNAQFWERILHKHIQIPARVLVHNPFPKSATIAKLHSLIAA